MRTPSSLLAVVAASIAALASGEARAASWTFTKSPAPWASHAVASATSGVDAMVLNVTTTGVGLTRVTRMAFLITGTVQTAEVANFQLVYYPAGLGSPGVVVGSNAGSGFAPGRTTSIVTIGLTAPIELQGDFTGVFALRVDVNGARSFFFQPQLQTVTIENDGVERYLVETGDLPLPGDSFDVT